MPILYRIWDIGYIYMYMNISMCVCERFKWCCWLRFLFLIFFFNFLVLAFLAFGSGFWRIVCPGQPARKPVNRALSLALSVCVLVCVCVCGEVSVCVWQLRCC